MSVIGRVDHVSLPDIRSGSSSSNVDKLEEAFKYSGLADFLAAAATPSSIPKLSGLPEVRLSSNNLV